MDALPFSRCPFPLLLISCSLLLSGCLHTVVTTGRPASNETVQEKWAHGFVVGLVPPKPLDVEPDCGAAGVSEVDLQQSFLNWLASAITQSIYTPQQFTVTCAAAGTASADVTPPAYLLRNPAETVVAPPNAHRTSPRPVVPEQ